jgi:ABC-2 type transport system permease protein
MTPSRREGAPVTARVVAVTDVLVAAARQQVAIVRSHPLFLIGGIVQPLVFLLVVFFARGRPTGPQVTGFATAVLLMAYWGSTVWQGAGILRRERSTGTLPALMRGVHAPMLVLAGKSLGASLAPALLTGVTVIATLAMLRAPLVVPAPGWFAVGLLAALLSGTALGTVLCSLFLLTRYGPQLSSALMYPVFLLAGLLIPTDLFPPWIAWLGSLVSLKWAQQFLVSLAGPTSDLGALAMVGVLTVAYALGGLAAFRRIDTLVRARGTLEFG